MNLMSLESSGAKITYHSYRSAAVTGVVASIELPDVTAFNRAVHKLKRLSGEKEENENHVVFLVEHTDGTQMGIGLTDQRVIFGTGVHVLRK